MEPWCDGLGGVWPVLQSHCESSVALADAWLGVYASGKPCRTPCLPEACKADKGDAACAIVHAGFKLSISAFLYFTLVFSLNLCVFTYFGQFLVFLTPSQGMANIIASGEP